MFKFGGDDPDEVGNLQQQLADCRIDLQRLNAENAMLREQIVQYETPRRANDCVLIVVK